MRKTVMALALTMVVGLAFMPIEGKAQMGPGYGMGQGGGYVMGPGMMGQGWGHGMGHGMMHRGVGPGMTGHGYGYEPQYQ